MKGHHHSQSSVSSTGNLRIIRHGYGKIHEGKKSCCTGCCTRRCNPLLPPRNRIILGRFVKTATHRLSSYELNGYGIANSIKQNNGLRVRRRDGQPAPQDPGISFSNSSTLIRIPHCLRPWTLLRPRLSHSAWQKFPHSGLPITGSR